MKLLIPILLLCMAATPASQPAKPSPLLSFVLISQVLQQNPGATQTQLNTAFLAEADSIIKRAKSVGCTRMICWDESCDDYQDFKYVGEPQLIHPKFQPVARQFFKRIRDAGIETGVTLRHGVLVRNVATGKLDYAQPLFPVWSLITKMTWAKVNYGASYAYCDTTVGPDHLPFKAGPMSLLGQVMPDMHWTLEFADPTDHYQAYGRWCDPRIERPIRDDGFVKLIGTMDQWDNSRDQEWRDAAARGDILMYAGWWDAPWNAGLFKALGISPITQP